MKTNLNMVVSLYLVCYVRLCGMNEVFFNLSVKNNPIPIKVDEVIRKEYIFEY